MQRFFQKGSGLLTFLEEFSAEQATILRKFLERVGRDQDILAVILFGSVVRGEADSLSDIDVCLVFPPGGVGRTAMAQKHLDYLTEFPQLDVQVFQLLPLYIRRRVLREGKVLYARDDDALYDVAYLTARAFENFKHLYYDYLEMVAHGS